MNSPLLWFLCAIMVLAIVSQMSTQGALLLGVIAVVFCFLKLWLDEGRM